MLGRRIRTLVGILVVVFGAAFGLLVTTAAPAVAHTASAPQPTNYRSRVISISPAVPGVRVRVIELGARLELTNTSRDDVTVLGYEQEPYLRVGPAGVYENLHSAATYLNRSSKGGSLPADVDTDPSLAPEWHKVSSRHVARWHDHRVHWMQPALPVQVQGAAGRFHHITVWRVALSVRGAAVTVTGQLDWVPAPSGLPWLALLVPMLGLGFVAAFGARRPRPLVVVTALAVLVDIAHAVSYELARVQGVVSRIGHFVGGNFVSIAVWITAVPTAIALLRRRTDALYGVVFVGVMIALVGGATDLAALWHSQLPVAGPAVLSRAAVIVSLGLGLGLAAGAVVRLARTGSAAREERSGRWIALLVTGLRDDELERIAAQLDADEVLTAAFADLATRLGDAAARFDDGDLVFVVTSTADPGPRVWSFARAGDTVRARPGPPANARAEVHTTFAVVLRLLGGTLAFGDAAAHGVAVAGDRAFVESLAPLLPEGAPLTDRAAAS